VGSIEHDNEGLAQPASSPAAGPRIHDAQQAAAPGMMPSLFSKLPSVSDAGIATDRKEAVGSAAPSDGVPPTPIVMAPVSSTDSSSNGPSSPAIASAVEEGSAAAPPPRKRGRPAAAKSNAPATASAAVQKPAVKKGTRGKSAGGTSDDAHDKAAGADGSGVSSAAPEAEGAEGADEAGDDEEDGDEVEHNERCSTCRRLDGSSQNPIVFCDG